MLNFYKNHDTLKHWDFDFDFDDMPEDFNEAVEKIYNNGLHIIDSESYTGLLKMELEDKVTFLIQHVIHSLFTHGLEEDYIEQLLNK